jgi:hypothetical protein
MTPSGLPFLVACALLPISFAGACGDDGGPGNATDAGVPDAQPVATFEECASSDQAFVRSAKLALLGTRPNSQAEVNVYTDIMSEIRLRNLADVDLDAGPAPTPVDPYEAVAEMLMRDTRFVDRWSEHMMDTLQVPRIEDQSQQSCYGTTLRNAAQGDDGGSLAAYVRDNSPMAGGESGGQFTMRDLLRSSLVLDDLSPVYRAHLFALVSRPIPAANVPPVQAELARRENFGNVFDAAFLNRDLTCMVCHNSQFSVTDNADPALSRHWDLPGLFEASIYGASVGIESERAHAPFRYDGFVANGGGGGDTLPWQWDPSCGEFFLGNLSPDPADIDGLFASLTGNALTVFDLERSLKGGFESITTSGLVIDDAGGIADPDAAFAYLVAANFVDGVWGEVIGSRLTIANHFPRNRESRDILQSLTEEFVANRFSLKSLLVDIVKSPYFNRLEPAAGCGAGPYNVPPVFDPWSIADESPELQNNSVGDALAPLSARTMLSAGYSALDWRRPFFESFPEQPSSIGNCANAFPSCAQLADACDNDDLCCYAEEYWCQFDASDDEPTTRSQRAFLRGVGVFLKHGQRGFRGLDFQARLVFEDRFAGCVKVDPEADFVDGLAALALTTPGATLGDLLAAMKDRLVGHARIEHEVGPTGSSEKQSLETYFGAELDTEVSELTNLDENLRGYCGVLLSTPQFLLSGLAAPDGRYEAILTPEIHRYDSVCNTLELPAALAGVTLQCTGDGLELQ